MTNDISTVKNAGIGGTQINPAQHVTTSEPALDPAPQLPRDHPRAPSDAIALTTRARQLVAAKDDEPLPSFGIHTPPEKTTLPMGPRRLEVDAGSYRLG